MNETIRQLMERKSVRAYEPVDIPEQDVQTILEAAVQAPSAGNMALWTAIRVSDPEKKQRLSVSCDNQPFIAKAPLVLVFCADYKRWFDLFATLALDAPLRRPGEGDFLLSMLDATIAAQSSVVAADARGRSRRALPSPIWCMRTRIRRRRRRKWRRCSKPGRVSTARTLTAGCWRFASASGTAPSARR